MPRRIPFAFACGAIFLGCVAGGYASAAAVAHAKAGKIIHVVARRFVFVPNEITLKKGEDVTLEFKAEEVLMGFNAPDFATRADLPPGQVARVRLKPDKTGTFPFLCDIFCGTGHENMSGVIKVVD